MVTPALRIGHLLKGVVQAGDILTYEKDLNYAAMLGSAHSVLCNVGCSSVLQI